jgi:hypothetical protein
MISKSDIDHGKNREDWPHDQNGRPEPMALLTQDGNYLNLDNSVLCGLLQSCGIPVRSLPISESTLGKVLLGQSWDNRFGYNVFVPAGRLEEAKEILSAPPVFEDEEGSV